MAKQATAKLDPELAALQVVLNALEGLTEEQQQQRVLRWAAERLKIAPATVTPAAGTGGGHAGAPLVPPGAVPTPEQFLLQKRPELDVERVTCLAYYLTTFRNTPAFKTKDLSALNDDAHGQPFSNISMACSNAMYQNQYLARHGKGTRRITTRGKALVETLPDRDRLKEVLSQQPGARRRRRRRARKAKGAK
jgi:hypothetical protein